MKRKKKKKKVEWRQLQRAPPTADVHSALVTMANLQLDDRSNPFVDFTYEGRCEALRFVLLAPLLAVQVTLGLGLFAAHAFFSFALALCLSTAALYWCYTPLCYAICRGIMATGCICVKVEGVEHWKSAAASGDPLVVVANHTNLFDPWAIGCAIGPFSPIVKANMANWPLFGTAVRAWRGIFVGRGANASNEGLDLAARCLVPNAGRDVPPLAIFPEGTCSNGEHLLTFRSGAFVARAPILPLALKWTISPTLGPGYVHPHSSVPLFLLRIMAQCSCKRVVVTILPRHVPSAAEAADETGRTLARAVEAKLASALQVPIAPYTNKDARAFYATLDPEYEAREI